MKLIMRNVVGLAATLATLVFLVTPARAEIPVQPPRMHVTNILTRSQQALVFDLSLNEYQLLKVGQVIGAFNVMEITDDFVVLGSTQRQGFYFVLSLPKALPPPPAHLQPAAPPKTDDGVLDPYIEMPGMPGGSMLDPYAPDPNATPTPPQRELDVLDPYSSARPPATPGLPAFPAPAPRTAPTPPPPYQISRGELSQAMSDFQELEREIQIQPTEYGVQVVGLATGSFMHRLGLRQGDLVLRVAGHPVNTNDGAASAYAVISAGKPFDVVVQRYGREVTLRYEITP